MEQHTGIFIEGVGTEWRQHELSLGETVRGEVLRLPQVGVFHGNRLILRTEDGVIAIPATAKQGHTLLERAITAKQIAVGELVEVEFSAWGETHDGERRYRLEEIRRIERPA